MTRMILLALSFFVVSLLQAEFAFIADGASEYAIVYPDSVGHAQLDYYHKLSAEKLQSLLQYSTGVTLPIYLESKMPAGQKAVYIGPVQKLGTLPPLDYWEHHIEIRDRDIFLYGQDARNSQRSPESTHRLFFTLGSLKATLTFLEQFADAVFLGTANDNDSMPKLAKIMLPEQYSYRKVPQIQFCSGGRRSLTYDVANNGFFGAWYGNYGGHSHDKAVPPELWDEHPEYFALRAGQRAKPHPQRPQHCLSNPEVQKLIYAELLQHIDGGFDMVQLNQSDGYSPCECEQCQNLYDIRPAVPPSERDQYRQDPCWGEKLWIMHRQMALQFQKDRPGKKLCIMAYGPTRQPPRTFQDFPENTVIDLAPFNPEVVEKWRPYQVPGGFTVYLYNWGWYKPEGFLPKQNWEFCVEQVKAFYANNIKGIYRCGFGELFGLEGPTYYIWCKLLDNPELDINVLLQKYCRQAFGAAAEEMEKFYRLLNERQKLQVSTVEIDWNDPALLSGAPQRDPNNIRTIMLRFPNAVVAELGEILQAAEQKSTALNELQRLLRLEFDYLNLTMSAVNQLALMRQNRTAEDSAKLLEMLIHREDFLQAIPRAKSGFAYWDGKDNGLPLFGYSTAEVLKAGGRLSGPLYAPFNWDVKWIKQHDIQLCGRSVVTNSGQMQYLLPAYYYIDAPAEVYGRRAVRFSCAWDNDTLRIVLLRENSAEEDCSSHNLYVYLGPNQKDTLFLPGRFKNGGMPKYVLEKTNVENQGLGDLYKLTGPSVGKVTVPAPGVELQPGEISALIEIPLEIFPAKPQAGEQWRFNFFYRSDAYTAIWERNYDHVNHYRNVKDCFGTLQFQ
jgi:hypothetical protein